MSQNNFAEYIGEKVIAPFFGFITNDLIEFKTVLGELKTQMATALELLGTANELLADIDAKTTAEGAEVKALADAYDALKAQIGQDNPDVVAALEDLNNKLRTEGDKISAIYPAPATPPLPAPTDSDDTAELPEVNG